MKRYVPDNMKPENGFYGKNAVFIYGWMICDFEGEFWDFGEKAKHFDSESPEECRGDDQELNRIAHPKLTGTSRSASKS